MPGDGIGPEITAATLDVLREADRLLQLGFEFEEVGVGLGPLASQGTTFPEAAFDVAKAADGVILGPVSHNDYPPADKGGINPSGALRKRLDLFANIRPARSRAGFPPRCGKPVDLVIVRENTEGFYADRNMFEGVRRVHADARPRARGAQDHAACLDPHRRGGVSFGDAAAPQGHRRAQGERAARLRRAVPRMHARGRGALSAGRLRGKIIDAMAALLVRDASKFDVIVTTNMFGDILSDEASEISGSLGLAASLNAGAEHAMAQAQHGSAPDIAGQDKANPASLIGSAAMLLAWLGERRDDARLIRAAAAIEHAIDAAIAVPDWRTADLGGPLGTKAFGARVAAALEKCL